MGIITTGLQHSPSTSILSTALEWALWIYHHHNNINIMYEAEDGAIMNNLTLPVSSRRVFCLPTTRYWAFWGYKNYRHEIFLHDKLHPVIARLFFLKTYLLFSCRWLIMGFRRIFAQADRRRTMFDEWIVCINGPIVLHKLSRCWVLQFMLKKRQENRASNKKKTLPSQSIFKLQKKSLFHAPVINF